MRNRKITIHIRTREQIILNSTASLTLTCGFCAIETRFFPPQVAARLSGMTIRTIFKGVEDGRLHFIESDESLLICSRSLELTRPMNVISIDGDVL